MRTNPFPRDEGVNNRVQLSGWGGWTWHGYQRAPPLLNVAAANRSSPSTRTGRRRLERTCCFGAWPAPTEDQCTGAEAQNAAEHLGEAPPHAGASLSEEQSGQLEGAHALGPGSNRC